MINDYSKLKMVVRPTPDRLTDDVVLCFDEGKEIGFIIFDKGNVVVEVKPKEIGVEYSPTLIAERGFLIALFHVLDEWAGNNGIPRETESFVKGQLEATKSHLKDMRNIVFDHNGNPRGRINK